MSNSPVTTVRLKPGREKSLRHRHPWVFSGAIQSVAGATTPGDLVEVVDASGEFLALAYFNQHSNIRARVLSWDAATAIDDSFWRERIATALKRREPLADRTNACRLIYSEADFLPGLVVDRYGDVIVTQFLTAGAERARTVVLDCLKEILKPAAVVDRSDTDSRSREGLEQSKGLLSGELPADGVEIMENGLRFRADVSAGHKTGFYLDQRENRRAVAAFAKDRRVLDAFSYTGAFSTYALEAGAQSATLVDSSRTALEMAQINMGLNGVDPDVVTFTRADVFELLRHYRDDGERFDMIVLDPPKFARNKKQLSRAMRGYKDVNLLAMQLLNPDGILATFSCSGGVDIESFNLAVSWAGLDAERDVQILGRLGHGVDHPLLVTFPECEYLKGLVCRVA